MSGLSLSQSSAEGLRRGGYRVLITGASGWLGRASLEAMSRALGERWTERVLCFGSAAATLRIRGGLSIEQRPLSTMGTVDRDRSILLHFAFLTKDKVPAMSVDDYREANRSISTTVREAAGRAGVERIFLVSSGAVYQALAAEESGRQAHPYGSMKLEEEDLFERLAGSRAGIKVVTARLFNLSGPYINKLGSYALASFIEQARDPQDGASIRIDAHCPVIRSYVGVGDLLNVAISHLLDDASAAYECFDTAGEREVEVHDLAEIVRSVVNPRASIVRPVFCASGADRYVGDGTKFKDLARRHGVPLQDLAEQVRATAEYLGAL